MTGYGTESRGIAKALLETGHFVINIAHETSGSAIVWGGKKDYVYPDGTRVLVLTLTNPILSSRNANDQVREYARIYQLDILIAHWDAFALDFLNEQSMPWLAYCPVESAATIKWANYLAGALKVVTYSRYGYDEFSRFVAPSCLAYIRHGVDTAKLGPPPEGVTKQSLRPLIKAEPAIPEDCFLFTCVAANNGMRKQIPLMLRTFAKLAKKDPNTHLYLHTNANTGGTAGFDLPMLVDMFGIKDRVHFPTQNPILMGIPDEEMARIYQASDCFLLNSLGEGFGLPVLESLACGVPAVVPSNSSMFELVGDKEERGWLVKNVDEEAFIEYPLFTPYLSTCPVADQRDLLRVLRYVVDPKNAKELAEKGRKGAEFAKQYDWKLVAKEWDALLKEVEPDLMMLREIATPPTVPNAEALTFKAKPKSPTA